jgi:hypothetical protein
MKELIFEAKCKRCSSINEVDFNKRFGETKRDDANYFISKEGFNFITYCPECLTDTFHEPVTLAEYE